MGRIRLADISTQAPKELDKETAKGKMQSILTELDDLQNLLFAESKHSVLVILQGPDASGKDGLIRNVFTTMNPQGITVKSFKTPTPLELSHDFLWRVHEAAPAKGMIQIFNRSHYEDILITRVHKWIDDETARKRMKAINDFERLLEEHNNTHILKFFLHVSPEEQLDRLTDRIKDPKKQWKYNENDFKEAAMLKEYQNAYEDCFEHCNDIPWIIVPADQNWYKEYLVASTLQKTLKQLDMKFPGLKKNGTTF